MLEEVNFETEIHESVVPKLTILYFWIAPIHYWIEIFLFVLGPYSSSSHNTFSFRFKVPKIIFSMNFIRP